MRRFPTAPAAHPIRLETGRHHSTATHAAGQVSHASRRAVPAGVAARSAGPPNSVTGIPRSLPPGPHGRCEITGNRQRRTACDRRVTCGCRVTAGTRHGVRLRLPVRPSDHSQAESRDGELPETHGTATAGHFRQRHRHMAVTPLRRHAAAGFSGGVKITASRCGQPGISCTGLSRGGRPVSLAERTPGRD